MSNVHRLYRQFEPTNYKLEIYPDKERMTFRGKVEIIGQRNGRPSKRIVLHSKDLKIKSASVFKIGKNSVPEEIKVERTVIQRSYDELRIHSDQNIFAGKYIVNIEFYGKITRRMSGLYPCFYDQGDKEEIILATQFESHHAREVFPCIDEPEAKAVFELKLLSQAKDTVLGNTEIAEQIKTKEGLINVFQPTPIMSTYLLAFVVGKLEYREGKTSKGVKIRAYARPELATSLDFAVDVAAKCIDLYNDYFGIDYPLSKCDLVALPDFASGAMENWGLITFREQGLIVDPNVTSIGMKQYVVSVIAHELVHQWFGNLVTMRWWNDLWLNESFATLMSYIAQDSLFPEWKSWTQFLVDEQLPALKLDSLENTHPINVEIHNPEEIRTIFDNISYEKGASILFMLKKYLGNEDFQAGLRLYLARHSYGNTDSQDLWNAWEEATHKPIAEFMKLWTTQPGYPLIRVDVIDNQTILSQERFYINPLAKKVNTLWEIPIFGNDFLGDQILKKSNSKFNIKAQNQIPINNGRNSFCRVIYDDSLLNIMIDQVKDNKLSELDRMGLLSDSFESSKAGYQSILRSLELLKAYKDEDSVVVWDVIATNINAIIRVMGSETLIRSMDPFIHELIIKQYTRLGWQEKSSDSYFDKLLRPLILGLACLSQFDDAISVCQQLFEDRNNNPLNPDLRAIIYTSIAQNGGQAEFDTLLKMHRDSKNSENIMALTHAITSFKQKSITEQSLALITSKDVRLQDVGQWIRGGLANRYTNTLAWKWIMNNWKWLEDNLSDTMSFSNIPRYVAAFTFDIKFLPEFVDFFNNHMRSDLERSLKQAIETITWQSEWKNRDFDNLKSYFTNKQT